MFSIKKIEIFDVLFFKIKDFGSTQNFRTFTNNKKIFTTKFVPDTIVLGFFLITNLISKSLNLIRI